VHQLLAHDPGFNPSVITSRFVDGLRNDIKAVVLVHRPKDLDTASSLAILQEEVLLGSSSKEVKQFEVYTSGKPMSKSWGQSVPIKQADQARIEDKKFSATPKSKPQSEKLATLMAYRKAKGLCYKCGNKWGPQHHCPESVSLHVVEELWQIFSEGDESPTLSSQSAESDSGDDLMALSAYAATGINSGKTIKLQASILQHKALVLLDSGSSHSFISEQMAALLSYRSPLKHPMKVQVVDGGILLCTHEVKNCPWLLQGTQLTTSFKILPLKCYDVILGMDWLEQPSPMQVQWAEKWFSFSHQGRNIKFSGIQEFDGKCQVIDGDQLVALHKQDEIWCIVHIYAMEENITNEHIPPELQAVLSQYSDVFAKPTSVPPSRPKDHTIPLLSRTQPFRLRPYRYTPFQNDEIEKQVAQLLKNDWIQASNSPYASPVLLVKKKTGEWRLCVDFRRLNAYTIKNKFPLPIIEELFEELFGAQWFTTSELRSGFH